MGLFVLNAKPSTKLRIIRQIIQQKSYLKSVFVVWACMLLALQGCQMQERLLCSVPYQITDVRKLPTLNTLCNDSQNYIPDPEHLDHFPVKTTLLNFHVIQNGEGQGNFEEAEAIHFLTELVERTNKHLDNNQRMHLDTTLPVLPVRWRFELDRRTGIQVHRDEQEYALRAHGRQRNLGDKGVFEKYGTQKGEVLNVFVMAHHLDSLKREGYDPSFNGVAMGTFIKNRGWIHSIQDTVWKKDGSFELPKYDFPIGDLIHEAGHIFTLRHAWLRDGCDDTPPHQNCWSWTPDWQICSNNIMDYNTWRNAITPCQIGKIHKAFHVLPKMRKLLKKDWCSYDASKTIIIDEPIEWNACKDFRGDIRVKKNGKLTIRCAVSMARGASIFVEPGATLILDGARLYNDCDENWGGIILSERNGKVGNVYYIREPTVENLPYTLLIVPNGMK